MIAAGPPGPESPEWMPRPGAPPYNGAKSLWRLFPQFVSSGRVVVLSDIHGNAQAFEAALKLARARGFDQLVILGDLLTYGCDPAAVLALTQEAIERDGAVLVKGNHDQLYEDLAGGDTSYSESLPYWIRESVQWTLGAVETRDLGLRFPWAHSLSVSGIYLAHANPFGVGDWTYLNKPAEMERAGRLLAEWGYAVGLFGHTHRAKLVDFDEHGRARVRTAAALGFNAPISLENVNSENVILVDPGSVGQPRHADQTSAMVMISLTERTLTLEFSTIDYDVEAHKRSIMNAPLSSATKRKILGYFRS
jgi:predicted phosphodiesterase